MRESSCDVLIVGGGTGGCAAAMAAASLGLTVIMTEETDWIGGQLTSQIVPPDEHPWIEQFGCTARYRRYRDLVRQFYRDHMPLTPAAQRNPHLNPGSGWVSKLCHEPRIGWLVLNAMLQPALAGGNFDLRLRRVPIGAEIDGKPAVNDLDNPKAHVEGSGERVRSVAFRNLDTGATEIVRAKFVLDATELGDLLPMTGTSYVVGAESKAETQEPNAVDGPAEWDNVQGITWCYALALDEGSNRVIDKPEQYEKWREYHPPFWPGKHLGFEVLHAHTGVVKELPLFGKRPEDWYCLFPYRQIVDPAHFESPVHPVTIVNWPMNDYFEGTILDVPEDVKQERLEASRQLSLSLLYWLQTEAPRHDGGVGYPGLYLRPDITGTADGFAMYPYIREARRIQARTIIKEQDVAQYTHPDGADRAKPFKDSVGVGSYRIDLHPSTNGTTTIDTSTLPFQIPLGSLVPVQTRNLLPACKNLGVTHITNGCYRLHPVEWNIGESAGLLAGFCLKRGTEPAAVLENEELLADYQRLLRGQGIELEWPQLRAL